ncbi:MAG: acetyltransferase family protein [Rhizobium sp.]|nr:acetyltransferase family protein [Rhizobium sp.]
MLRLATAEDITAIMAIERSPGYDQLVGRSSAGFHARAIADPDYVYLVGLRDDGTIGGFGILRGITDIMGNVTLKRIAVASPGQGFGKALLLEIIGWVFENTSTHRFWLDHIITNDRAAHVYESCGFQREGVMRQAYALPDGERIDLALMSILRPEWEAR